MVERITALLYGILAGTALMASLVSNKLAHDDFGFIMGLVVAFFAVGLGLWMPWLNGTGRPKDKQ
jgi:ABC-type uncharacterized transport system permease subunit